jgi:hypothetical protein
MLLIGIILSIMIAAPQCKPVPVDMVIISGILTLDGAPVADFPVNLVACDPNFEAQVVNTDAEGKFQFEAPAEIIADPTTGAAAYIVWAKSVRKTDCVTITDTSTGTVTADLEMSDGSICNCQQ